MLTEKEKIEYELLNLLADVQDPVGSVTLSLLLKEKNLDISGATVGRKLSSFDHQGLTVKQGFRGRVLTGAGFKKLTDFRNRKRQAEVSSKFYESIDVESKDNLVDLLIARRGIERETVRLAAIHATDGDIQRLRALYNAQAKDAADGIITSDNDVLFHQALARASKNKVLAAAYDFIWQNGHYSPVMEYIRSAVGGVLALDHGNILNALITRNPDNADKCMIDHIDGLISDVHKYWSLAQKVIGQPSPDSKGEII